MTEFERCSLWWCPAGRLPTSDWCLVHNFAQQRTGSPMGVPLPTAEERFWLDVHKTDYCWEWVGYLYDGRYGRFHYDGKMMPAHRYSYMIATGEIPPKHLHIDHLCRNTRCVNPEHLELVTPRENVIRGVRSRGMRTHCVKGHYLSPDNVRVERGKRRCLTCSREYALDYSRRKHDRKHLFGLPPVNGIVKTHCPQGHKYRLTEEGKNRPCGICARDATRRYRARKRGQLDPPTRKPNES